MFQSTSSLVEICNAMTHPAQSQLSDANYKLCQRLVCPEYSKSVHEIKTYPLLEDERIFALCWRFDSEGYLYASTCPTSKEFCYKFNLVEYIKQLSDTAVFDGMTQLHTHDYIELSYIVSGTFHQKILGQDITFHAGEFCLIDKNCLHQDDLKNKDATILFLGIANDMFGEIMDENISARKIILFLQTALTKQKHLQQYLHFKPENGTAIADISKVLTLLITELYHHDIGSNYICKGVLLRIFRILSTQYNFSLSKEQRATMNWVIFDEVSDYMHHHYAHMSIQNLVEHFHFQEDYFNRLIKSKTGMTYSAYMQQIRLEKAKQLLQTTPMTIDAVAEAVGYHNKGYFYKIFTEQNGITPMQYRKNNS